MPASTAELADYFARMQPKLYACREAVQAARVSEPASTTVPASAAAQARHATVRRALGAEMEQWLLALL